MIIETIEAIAIAFISIKAAELFFVKAGLLK